MATWSIVDHTPRKINQLATFTLPTINLLVNRYFLGSIAQNRVKRTRMRCFRGQNDLFNADGKMEQ
jgi:hypothetical protein